MADWVTDIIRVDLDEKPAPDGLPRTVLELDIEHGVVIRSRTFASAEGIEPYAAAWEDLPEAKQLGLRRIDIEVPDPTEPDPWQYLGAGLWNRVHDELESRDLSVDDWLELAGLPDSTTNSLTAFLEDGDELDEELLPKVTGCLDISQEEIDALGAEDQRAFEAEWNAWRNAPFIPYLVLYENLVYEAPPAARGESGRLRQWAREVVALTWQPMLLIETRTLEVGLDRRGQIAMVSERPCPGLGDGALLVDASML